MSLRRVGISLVCVLVIGIVFGYLYNKVYRCNTEHAFKLVVLQTMQRHERSLSAIKLSLMKEYKIPEAEAKYHAWLFDELRYQNAKKYKVFVPWELYAATFWKESNLRAHAISPSGAKGKAQTIEETFKISCARMSIPYTYGVSIWHDWLNMTAGADILSKNYSKGYTFTIKAYYGGDKFVDCKGIQDYYHGVDSLFERMTKTYKEIYDSLGN